MYGEMYKDALSPVICVIVRRHLSTLIRTATFEIPDQLPIRTNPTIDSTQILCHPTVCLPLGSTRGSDRHASASSFPGNDPTHVDKFRWKGNKEADDASPRGINPFELLPPTSNRLLFHGLIWRDASL